MAELLENLVANIRNRRGGRLRRPQLGEVSDTVGGLTGAMSSLDAQAMSDKAQGIDISSAAPSTRLRAGKIETGETPVQLEQTEGGETSPFKFASGNQDPAPVQQTSGPVRVAQQPQQGVRRVCGPNGCTIVSGSAQPQQAYPGISLAPGETLVPGSVREVVRTPGQQSAQGQPAGQPQAQAKPSYTPLIGYDGQPLEEYRHPEYWFNRAKQEYAAAESALASGNAPLFVQSDERGDMAFQAGLNAVSAYQSERAARAQADLFEKQFAWQKEQADKNTPSSLLKQEQEALKQHEVSRDTRADFLTRLELAGSKVAPDEKQVLAIRDRKMASIVAHDAAHYAVLLQQAERPLREARDAERTGKGGPVSEDLIQQHRVVDARLNTALLERYGNVADFNERLEKMGRELGEVMIARYQQYHTEEAQRTGEKVTPQEIVLRANRDATKEIMKRAAVVGSLAANKSGAWSPVFESLRKTQQQEPQQEQTPPPRFNPEGNLRERTVNAAPNTIFPLGPQ